MNSARKLVLTLGVGLCTWLVVPETSDAAYRQYYSGWQYYPKHEYHYRRYFYKPNAKYRGYNYHYAIHYTKQPRYIYYYNPGAQQYWGRFDTQGSEGAQYSLLAKDDRKKNLKEIPESAFPDPGSMPVIPGSEDGVRIEPPQGPLPR